MTTSQMSQNTSNPAKKPVVGVLLVHGLNGTSSDFAGLEEFLQDRGMLTNNMLLPGHGVHVRELISKGWSDWEKAVRQELQALKQRCDVVFLVGHSLGGALALHVAAHEEVAGIVSMCAPLYMHPWTELVVGLAKRVTPLLPSLGEDVHWQILRRSYHVIMKDHDREEVFAKTAAFITRYASKASAQGAIAPAEQTA